MAASSRGSNDFIAHNQQYAEFYVTGAAFTLVATTFVITTYAAFPRLRKHPAPLLFWMSVCDFVFALSFLVEYFVDPSLCVVLSSVTQVSVFASEMFFAMHALDLYYAATHPFTLDSLNMRKYHLLVWSTSILTGLLVGGGDVFGSIAIGFCWIRDGEWAWYLGLLIVPIGLAYLGSIAVLVWAARRLRRGMPATFATRLRVLYKLRTTVAICTLYTLILVVLAVVGVLQRQRQELSYATNAATALVIGSRGIANALVWVFTRDVLKMVRIRVQRWAGRRSPGPEESVRGPGVMRTSLREIALDISDRKTGDDTLPIRGELSESVNFALRAELMQATSDGIVAAVRRAAELYDAPKLRTMRAHDEANMYDRTRAWLAGSITGANPFGRAQSALFSSTTREADALEQADYDLVEHHAHGVTDFATEVTFHDFAPRIFHSLRRHFSIDDEAYVSEMSGSRREKFSEGKSGAFLYFSSSGKYIVKTTSAAEALDLMKLLPDYYRHVMRHPHSLLLRYLGLHAITLYGRKMHFVVMESVFATDLKVHERYDLKGSWVGRRAKKLVDKRRGVRKIKKEAWPQFTTTPLGPGFREVRKDLDLTRPLILHPTDAYRIGSQLRVDASFLAAHRIMDYSLLLGIHNQHFRVRTREGGMGQGTSVGSGSLDGSGPADAASLHVPHHRSHQGGVHAVVVEGPGVYFMGIIDILQTFSMRKRLEYFVKRYLLAQGLGISCVPPELYARRFVSNVVETFIEPPADEPEAAIPRSAPPMGALRHRGRSGGTLHVVVDGDQRGVVRALPGLEAMPEVEPATPGQAGAGALANSRDLKTFPIVKTDKTSWWAEICSWILPLPEEQRQAA